MQQSMTEKSPKVRGKFIAKKESVVGSITATQLKINSNIKRVEKVTETNYQNIVSMLTELKTNGVNTISPGPPSYRKRSMSASNDQLIHNSINGPSPSPNGILRKKSLDSAIPYKKKHSFSDPIVTQFNATSTILEVEHEDRKDSVISMPVVDKAKVYNVDEDSDDDDLYNTNS